MEQVTSSDPWANGVGRPLAEIPLPVLVLRESAVAHNIALMQRWCDDRGVSLAPHGKTTMAPALIRRQLEAGAWGMTAATVPQLAVMREAGAQRVILANELVGAPEIAWFERERADIEAYCLVDSVDGVRALAAGVERPLGVLIELGGPRAGCRTLDQALAVADAVAGAPRLVLAGVEGFEGTLPEEAVDPFVDRMRELVEALDARGAFAGVDEIIATAGGSAFFDHVVDAPAVQRPVTAGAGRAAFRLLRHARRRHLRGVVAAGGSAGRRSSCGRACYPARSRVWRSRASASATPRTTSGCRSCGGVRAWWSRR